MPRLCWHAVRHTNTSTNADTNTNTNTNANANTNTSTNTPVDMHAIGHGGTHPSVVQTAPRHATHAV